MSYFNYNVNFRKQTQFFKDASEGETSKYEAYLKRLCNRNDGLLMPMPSFTEGDNGEAKYVGKCLHAEKLAVFTFDDLVAEMSFRRWFKTNWKTLTLGMDNSTILFIAGIYIDDNGRGGPREDIQTLKNQVQ